MSSFETNRHLANLNANIEALSCGLANALSTIAAISSGAPVPPSVSCSTIKCCTDTCEVVHKTTCETTEIIFVPGTGGEGEPPTEESTKCSKKKPNCGKPNWDAVSSSAMASGTYEVGEIVEEVTCTDASGAQIPCPDSLIPNCNPDQIDIIINPNPVCIEGPDGTCIENVTQLIKIEYDCIVPKDPVCHGYLIDGNVVPCDEVTEIECPRYITLNNPICMPGIVIPEPCTYVELKDCPK